MRFKPWLQTIFVPWLERELAGPASLFRRRSNRDDNTWGQLTLLAAMIALTAGGLDALCHPQPWSTGDMVWMGVGALAALGIVMWIFGQTSAHAES